MPAWQREEYGGSWNTDVPCIVQEAERVMDTFKNHLHLPVTKIDDSKRMLARLKVSLPLTHVFNKEIK